MVTIIYSSNIFYIFLLHIVNSPRVGNSMKDYPYNILVLRAFVGTKIIGQYKCCNGNTARL